MPGPGSTVQQRLSQLSPPRPLHSAVHNSFDKVFKQKQEPGVTLTPTTPAPALSLESLSELFDTPPGTPRLLVSDAISPPRDDPLQRDYVQCTYAPDFLVNTAFSLSGRNATPACEEPDPLKCSSTSISHNDTSPSDTDFGCANDDTESFLKASFSSPTLRRDFDEHQDRVLAPNQIRSFACEIRRRQSLILAAENRFFNAQCDDDNLGRVLRRRASAGSDLDWLCSSFTTPSPRACTTFSKNEPVATSPLRACFSVAEPNAEEEDQQDDEDTGACSVAPLRRVAFSLPPPERLSKDQERLSKPIILLPKVKRACRFTPPALRRCTSDKLVITIRDLDEAPHTPPNIEPLAAEVGLQADALGRLRPQRPLEAPPAPANSPEDEKAAFIPLSETVGAEAALTASTGPESLPIASHPRIYDLPKLDSESRRLCSGASASLLSDLSSSAAVVPSPIMAAYLEDATEDIGTELSPESHWTSKCASRDSGVSFGLPALIEETEGDDTNEFTGEEQDHRSPAFCGPASLWSPALLSPRSCPPSPCKSAPPQTSPFLKSAMRRSTQSAPPSPTSESVLRPGRRKVSFSNGFTLITC